MRPSPHRGWQLGDETGFRLYTLFMARPILLAVDDDVSVLEAVVQDLRRQYGATYRVMRAASGPAALDTLAQLKTRDEPVALIVSDQRMPGMSGVEMLESARTHLSRRAPHPSHRVCRHRSRHPRHQLRTHPLLPQQALGSARGEALPRRHRPPRRLAGRLPAALRRTARHRSSLVAQRSPPAQLPLSQSRPLPLDRCFRWR